MQLQKTVTVLKLLLFLILLSNVISAHMKLSGCKYRSKTDQTSIIYNLWQVWVCVCVNRGGVVYGKLVKFFIAMLLPWCCYVLLRQRWRQLWSNVDQSLSDTHSHTRKHTCMHSLHAHLHKHRDKHTVVIVKHSGIHTHKTFSLTFT